MLNCAVNLTIKFRLHMKPVCHNAVLRCTEDQMNHSILTPVELMHFNAIISNYLRSNFRFFQSEIKSFLMTSKTKNIWNSDIGSTSELCMFYMRT